MATIGRIEYPLDSKVAPASTYAQSGILTGSAHGIYDLRWGRWPIIGVSHPIHASDIGLSATDLRNGVVVGDVSGVLQSPSPVEVKIGVGYGANGTEYIGTLATGVARSRIQTGM